MQRFTHLFLIGILLIAQGSISASNKLPDGLLALQPRPAPAIDLTDIDGETYKLTEDAGSLVFVHFWASWCRPCRREMPAIQRMWNILRKDGLKIAVINTAENEDTVFSFLGAHAPDIRALMDRDGQVTEKWQPRGLPATYLVDHNGNIIYQALGGRPWDSPQYIQFLRSLQRRGH